MADKSYCNFSKSVEQRQDLIKFITGIASKFVISKSKESPKDYFNKKIEDESLKLKEDEKKLLFLDFLSLINLPADEIEAVYLNTIFKLKDDETMITQLADFVEYSSI